MSQDSGSDNGAGSSSGSSSSGYSEKLSNKRSPNWSDFEIRTLCEFVKEHKAKLFGLGEEANKKGVNAAKKKHWELAAVVINEKCATNRHWSQVRKKWKDLSYYARSSNKKKFHDSSPSKESPDRNPNEEEGHVIKLSEIDNYNLHEGASNDLGSSTVSSSCSNPGMAIVREVNVKTEALSSEHERPLSPAVSLSECRCATNSSNFQSHNKVAPKEGCNKTSDCACQDTAAMLQQVLEKVLHNRTPALNFTMSTYEKARLEIERDKYELQRNAVKYLREISKEVRQIGVALCRTKRRRSAGDFLSKKRQRWRSESDSSV